MEKYDKNLSTEEYMYDLTSMPIPEDPKKGVMS
jgi:hypothetical protein